MKIVEINQELGRRAILRGFLEAPNINSENPFSELVLPVLKTTIYGDSRNISEGISLKILEKLAGKTDLNTLAVYTQREILERIISENEYERINTPIIEFSKNLRYRKIINFLKYLNSNSSADSTIPKDYYDFKTQFNTLLEN